MFQSIYRQTLLDERSFFAPHGRSALFRSGSPPLLFFPLLCQSFRRLSRRDGLAWADEEMKRGRSNHRHANGPPSQSSLHESWSDKVCGGLESKWQAND